MAEKRLRAVKDGDEPATRPVPSSISEAVQSGSGRDVLAAMRKQLARKLDDGEVSSNALASSYRELRELDRLIRLADTELEAEMEKRRAESSRSKRSFKSSAV